MFCDECAVEPALIDHLDFSLGQASLRRLCGRCADAERRLWDKERLGRPAQGAPLADKDRRAA